MLHINFIREHPDVVREDLKKRGEAEKLVWLDNLLKKDEEYKKTLQEEERIRHKRKEITLAINKLKKEGKGIREKLEEAKQIPQQIAYIYFFQAEDGIRDWSVTGVQTCALLFSSRRRHTRLVSDWSSDVCSSDRSEEHTSELQSLTNPYH